MKFKIKKIPSPKMSIGQRLKRARRRKKLSLEKLEGLTKIKKRYLEDIERNNFDNLPSDVYAKGFLSRYAQVVGLDAGEIVDFFSQERGLKSQTAREELKDFSKSPVEFPKVLITSRLIVTVISILLFLGFSGYIFTQVRSFAKAPKLEIISPESFEFSANSSGLKIEGKTDTGASIFINEQAIGVDLEGAFAEEVRLREGLNEIKVSARNKAHKETSKIIKVAVKLPPIAKKKVLGEKAEGLNLKLEIAPNPVWLSVDIDGKRVFQGIMLKGTSQEFQAEKEIILNCGNSGSTHVIFNGIDQGILGKEGEAKKGIKYTLDMLE